MFEQIVESLRSSRGIAAKTDIARVAEQLGFTANDTIRVGDDCAAIPDGDGYLLLAIEGFINEFVAADPWFAGWCGVMVNVSDIAAMGGRPIAVVNAIWSAGDAAAEPILQGLRVRFRNVRRSTGRRPHQPAHRSLTTICGNPRQSQTTSHVL